MKTANTKYLVRLIKEARFVFVCGNGGSSATAEHFTNDLFSRGIKAVCLNSNVSIMTMIANDYGYEYIYSKQLELYANYEDLLIVFSGSGQSKNIIEAVKNKNIGHTFAIVGMDGGEVMKLAGDSILFRDKQYGKIEDEHMRIVHKVADLLGDKIG